MKKSLSILFLILISSSLTGCFFQNNQTKPSSEEGVNKEDFPTNSSKASEPEKELSYEERVDLTRKRVALRSIIRKGDYYKARNDAETAIKFYQNAIMRIGDDPKIILRLADAYFELKNFGKAYEYYSKLSLDTLDEPTKLRFIGSVMLDKQRGNRAGEIAKYPFSTGTKEYYALVDKCILDNAGCLATILANNSEEPRIRDLRSLAEGASQISEDDIYKKALVSGKLYEQGSFLAAAALSRNVLDTRPDYKEVIKIRGFSLYEIGDYRESADLLEKYYNLTPTDYRTAYMLGIIHYIKEDYSTSNLYFNAAVLAGYTPKTELERRLIYNYILLGDSIGAFKIFRYLLNEADASSEDFQIGIYLALSTNDLSKAALWSQKSLIKFPEDSMLLAFAGQISRLSNNPENIESFLSQSLQKDPKNAFALLEMGRLFLSKNEYTLAQTSFEEAISIDQNGIFGSDAQKELSLLKNISGENFNTGSLSPLAPPSTSSQ